MGHAASIVPTVPTDSTPPSSHATSLLPSVAMPHVIPTRIALRARPIAVSAVAIPCLMLAKRARVVRETAAFAPIQTVRGAQSVGVWTVVPRVGESFLF